MNLDNLMQIQALLSQVESYIAAAMARAQQTGNTPNDALRGLIISSQEAAHLQESGPMADFWSDKHGPPPPIEIDPESATRFTTLMSSFALSALDAQILLLCLAPEFDRRYERLYAYLQDDVSQRKPTVNLMMNLLGQDVTGRFAVWERLAQNAPLRHHLLLTANQDTNSRTSSLLSHHLNVDHRLVAWLMGDSTPDTRLKDSVSWLQATGLHISEEAAEPIVRTLPDAPIVLMQGTEGVGRRESVATMCAQYDLAVISADLAQFDTLEIPSSQAWRLTIREAHLEGTALLFSHWDSCLNETTGQAPADLWQAILDFPYPVFLCTQQAWEPPDLHRLRPMLRVSFDLPSYEKRKQLWTQTLEQRGMAIRDLDPLVAKYRFTPAQISRAVNTAADLAASAGSPMCIDDLYAAAQAHSAIRLGRLAKQIKPRYGWDDLVLPSDRLEQLRELCARAEHAYLVQENWGIGRKIAPTPRISALFAGESGTGKTMAAEAIAHELGLPLYRIDLSAVVSKYIGETEKNLSIIFEEAKASNAILFFDEADAIFGKRSEVRDAHDRYANIEVAYLLQQIEDYDGIAILATNLRQNLDDAFTRRLDFAIDFPFPESEYRKLIWAGHFPPELPLSPDVNFDTLAERYPLAGGNIRNVAIAAAYLAAADGRVVTMEHIVKAIRREHQKIGRLMTDEF